MYLAFAWSTVILPFPLLLDKEGTCIQIPISFRQEQPKSCRVVNITLLHILYSLIMESFLTFLVHVENNPRQQQGAFLQKASSNPDVRPSCCKAFLSLSWPLHCWNISLNTWMQNRCCLSYILSFMIW